MIEFLTNGGPLWIAAIGIVAGIIFVIVKFAVIDRRKLKGIGSALRQDADAWKRANPSMGRDLETTVPEEPTQGLPAYVEPRTYRVLAKIPGGELDISEHVISIVVPDEIALMLDHLRRTVVYPSSGASTAPEGAREAGTTAGAENHDDQVASQA